MSLHFLLGKTGSGKSTQLIEEIIGKALAHPEQSFLLLVPEQFCLSTQRLLIERHPRHALINIEALSFDRLAGRAFREFGIPPESVISDTVKQMIIALAVRDALPQLTVYGRQALHPSFGAHVSTLFAEWEMNGINPAALAESAEEKGLPALLEKKLKDLSVLFTAYRKRLGEKLTAEERLPLFSRLLPKSGVGRADHLYLDGFTGFTGVQYRILEQLMARAKETTAALTLPEGEDPEAWFDPKKRHRDELYAMSQETVWRLMRIAEGLGQKHEDVRFSHRAPERAAELAFLSGHLMQPGRETWESSPENICLFAPESPEEEAEWAAGRIRALTRRQNLRYREIALLVSDQTLYVPFLEKYFKEAGIPYFTDQRESLSAHPLIRLLEDAWETVSGGRERDAFLRYVKNPCGPLTRDESDILENYLLAAGIRGGKRLEESYAKRRKRRPGESAEDWTARTDEELAQVNALREKAFAPLLPVKEAVGRGKFTARAAAEALLGLTEDPEMAAKLETLTESWRQQGEEEKAAAWQEAGEAVREFLQSLAEIFGESRFSRAELTDMLKAGLARLTVGKLPRSSDQIVIGDVERSRFGAVRHLIFLGLNADLMPKPRGGGGLLTDEERLLLASEDTPAYTDERAVLEERFYLYSLLSLPRESLDLCWSRMDSGRKAKQPSSLIREIRQLFPLLKEQQEVRKLSDIPAGEAAALRLLAEHFEENDPAWPLLYRLLRESSEEKTRAGLKQIEDGSGYRFEAVRILPETAAALYGRTVSGSVTRLESFAACPYKHFLRYGLAVGEREEFSWEMADHGSFFHQVMETLLRHLKEEKLRPSEMSEDARRQEVALALKAAREKYPDFEENINASYLLSRWSSFFERYLEAMGSWDEEGAFRPDAFELYFGPQNKTALRIPLKNGASLSLQGIIDRLDTLEEDDRLYLRVVDYKTGDKQLDFGAAELGTQLQLGAYLAAAEAFYQKKYPDREVLPGGLYYALLKENWIKDWKAPELREEELRKGFLLQGLTAGEVASRSPDAKSSSGKKAGPGTAGLALFGRSICRKLKELGERILDGEIAAVPVQMSSERDSCSFCPYTALCDRRNEAFEYRTLPKVTAEDYLQKAKEAEDGIH